MRLPWDKEVAEQKLGSFREKLKIAIDKFQNITEEDSEVFSLTLQSNKTLANVLIDNIALQSEAILSSYETDDAGRHWRTRRSGYWGYMHQLQARVANAIFPKVSDLLNNQTNHFINHFDKFRIHLNSFSNRSEDIAKEVELGSEIHIGVESRLSAFMDQTLSQTESLIEVEQSKILCLLDSFVSEDVEENISIARNKVTDIWGKGTTIVQNKEVRAFYHEVKSILRRALVEHLWNRHDEYTAYLSSVAKQLPRRAISETEAELANAEQNIRAAATASIQGQKEQFEQLSSSLITAIQVVVNEIVAVFGVEYISNNIVPAGDYPCDDDDKTPVETTKEKYSEPVASTQALAVAQTCDELRALIQEATKFEKRFVLYSGRSGVSYKKIFTNEYIKNCKSALLIDPYLHKPHQIRNLIEFIDSLLSETKLRTLYIETGIIQNDDIKHGSSDLDSLSEQAFKQAGLTIEVSRVVDCHDRFAIFDNGVVYKLGRGLDIFKPAMGLASKNQEVRKVRDCTIDVFTK
jgi:hypothetical protein